MTSLLCVKQPGGTVQVHAEKTVQEILHNESDHKQFVTKTRKKSAGLRSSSQNIKAGNYSVDSKSLIGHTMKIQDWLNEKTVKDLQERSDAESRTARRLYSPILETEDTFVRDVEGFLEHKDMLDLRKKELLHKKWNEHVYEPMRRQIIDVMEGYNWHDLDRRKREMHKQYLEFVNQKGHIFLDTMDPGEYYAQALNGHRPAPIKVETDCWRDPLLSQSRDRNTEERIILRCMTGNYYTDRDLEQVKLPPLPLVPLGRHGTDSIRWLEMPLVNIESSPRQVSRRRMHGLGNETHLDFEQWLSAPFDPAVIDKEMKTQKKRMFKETPPYNIHPVQVPHPPMIEPVSTENKQIGICV